MTKKSKTVFLTGATGLIGSYLLRIFIREGYKVYVLVREKNGNKIEERVINILNFWDGGIPPEKRNNLVILKGDITKKNLALSGETIDLLKNEIDEIFHSAAITNLDWPIKELHKVNVNGVKNVLELAMRCSNRGKLKKVNHLSTAYICGNYKGRFSETDLDVGQKFDNTYEQSKFEGEKVVEKYRKKGLWIDIFRPSIVVGESSTGKITQFKNIYHFVHICAQGIFESLPISDSYMNLVPIDYLAEAIHVISAHTGEKNRNYHTFPRKRVSLEEIIDSAGNIMGFKKPEIIQINNFDTKQLTAVQKMILRKSIFSVNLNINLHSFETIVELQKYGFVMQEISNEVLSNIFGYFNNKGYSATLVPGEKRI